MRKIFFLGIALTTVFSCTKTITPGLNTIPPQLVIEGAISDTAALTIYLS